MHEPRRVRVSDPAHWVWAALVAAMILAGCSESPDKPATEKFVVTRLDKSNFVDPMTGSNKWLPLKPGTQWVRDGTTLIGNRQVPNLIVTTVTDVVREVAGVKTVLVHDHGVAAGQVVQDSLDYLAQDKAGNVWDLGSTTEQYEAGRFIAVDEAWLHGVDGATGGILMPANPKITTPAWAIATPPEEPGDAAEVVETGKRCVLFGCYGRVIVIREGKEDALDNEFKYYAYGVGQILNEPREKGRHDDFEELINIIQLSPQGLAEASRTALRIDRTAAKEWPKVYRDDATAKRAP
jgi:hypothetical protein